MRPDRQEDLPYVAYGSMSLEKIQEGVSAEAVSYAAGLLVEAIRNFESEKVSARELRLSLTEAQMIAANLIARTSAALDESTPTDQPKPTLLPYATTKGAIANFTAGLAQLLADRGIRVNSVLPGPIWTPLIPSTMAPDKVEHFGENTPLGRPGQPAELAPAYVLLASNDGS